MIYENVTTAVFIERPNRFIAYCELNGERVKCHVPNTGRCKELFIPGAKVILSRCSPEKEKTRKTIYTVVSVYKGNRLINIDSQSPNAIAYEALKDGSILGNCEFTCLEREKTFDKSRFDIYYERIESCGINKGFIEVKGVTLEKDGNVFFPDAPTLRGEKHLRELIKAVDEGYEAGILFIVQMDDVDTFYPNYEMHKEFAKALIDCFESGVNIMCYSCNVSPSEVKIKEKVKVCDLKELPV